MDIKQKYQQIILSPDLFQQFRQPLFINAGYIFGVNVAPAIIGFLFWGIVARLYSASDIGIASAIISVVTLVSSLAGFGTNIGLIRFLPESTNPINFLNSIYWFNFFASLLGCGIFVLGISLWSPGLEIIRNNLLYLISFVIFVIVATLGTVVRDTFVARRQSKFAFIYTIVSNVLRIILVFFGVGLNALGIISTFAGAFSIALISMFMMIPKVVPGYQLRFELNIKILQVTTLYSLSNYLTGLLSQMGQTLLPILTLNVLGAEANGKAFVALMMGSLLTSPGLALAYSAFAEGANNPSNAIKILYKTGVSICSITIPLMVIVVIAAPWLLLPFGSTYVDDSASLLRWMAIAGIPIVLNQLYFTYLRVDKRVKQLVWLSGMTVFTSLSISFLLLPIVGISACGIGMAAGNGIIAVLIAVMMSRSGLRKLVSIQTGYDE